MAEACTGTGAWSSGSVGASETDVATAAFVAAPTVSSTTGAPANASCCFAGVVAAAGGVSE